MTNPFDDPPPPSRRQTLTSRKPKREDPIWEAHHIEWPLPRTLPSLQVDTNLDVVNDSVDKTNPGYLGGLVGKFIGQSSIEKETIESQLHGKTKALKAPRPHCTAASNGWIVSLVESGSTASVSHVRLLSRWNVRRNTHQWLIVPNTRSAPGSNMVSSSKKGRIVHVFTDPTGCHTLLSGSNGDLFYSHPASKTVRKLNGFGLNTDGSGSFRPGKAWRDVSASSMTFAQKESAVQLGLTPGCYITAVGWNKMGTEGATNKILLGSSFGEIYEYEMELEEDDNSTRSSGGVDEYLPSLIVRLNESESGTGTGTGSGLVSGLYFAIEESETAGAVVLAATSGVNKQTRLHSYLSVGDNDGKETNGLSQKLRRAFSSDEDVGRKSFLEIPGSLGYADLNVCDGSFAMRTETGIYHGTIDQSNGRSAPWNKRGNGIVDAGMFSYETSSIPISIAITPHHFITLDETNEVRFISRVAKKTIQKDRVDWISMAHSSGSNVIDDGLFTGHAELIMDVRRADQVWLQKSRSLVHISSKFENRDVWKFSLISCLQGTSSHGAFTTHHASMRRLNDDKYMDAGFDHAKSLCTNATQKAVVTAARAEFHLSHGRIELAAKYMAQCPPSLVPFAETAIRLSLPSLGIKDSRVQKKESVVAKEALKGGNIGLISYLTDKMRSAKSRNDGVACTMIGAWLVELYLHEQEHSGAVDSQEPQARNTKDMHHAMMQQFLSSNTYSMDAKTILRILCSHDVAASECSAYAASSGDIGTAINAALCNVDYMVSNNHL